VDKPYALVVEDNKDVAFIFAEAVKEAGYDVEIIGAGDIALKRLSSVVPDLVILDLHLPYVKGTDILDQIRCDDRLADTNVIVTSADSRMAEMLHEKADLVLLKPVGYGQLRDMAARMRLTAEPADSED
jgi:CheY-like chemotaxis protein